MRSRGNRRFVLPVLSLAAAASVVVPGPPAHAGGPATCHGLEVTIVGTDRDDDLTGTLGDDVIAGLGGSDVIHALGGDDVVCGGAGDDQLYGEGGDDRIDAGSTAGPAGTYPQQINGGTGDDVLRSGPDYAYAIGGAGADDILVHPRPGGRRGADVLPGPGRDRVVLRGATASRWSTVDYDSSRTGVSVDLDQGTAQGPDIGHDRLVGVHHVVGSRSADRIIGSSGADTIDPGGGRDVVLAGGGADYVSTVEAADVSISGGPGDDHIESGSGDDHLRGGPGDDFILADPDYFEDGDDHVRGGGGDDVLRGRGGDDSGDGGPGADRCVGFESVMACESR